MDVNASESSFKVNVFRRTLARGWELFRCSRTEGDCKAIPKKKQIEIRALKLRLWLTKATAVIKRGRSLLIEQRQNQSGNCSSKRKNVIVVLQFVDTYDCNSFCDRLMQLNSKKSQMKQNVDHKQILTGRPEAPSMNQAHQGKRTHHALHEANHESATALAVTEESISHIVRILHDRSFQTFVDQIENVLESSSACSGILSNLGTLSNPRMS